MASKIQPSNWASRQRLRFIETCAWWKGTVNRNDLGDLFSISMAQASSDLQAYMELNPGSIAYNMRQKRYEASSAMKWVIARPQLAEAAHLFLGDESRLVRFGTFVPDGGACFGAEVASDSEERATVERRAVLAVTNGYRIRIRYLSAGTGRDEWRRIRPHALGSDGCRWHLRAWCERGDRFRDFSIRRIMEIEWTRDLMALPRPDVDWETLTVLKLRPNRSLDAVTRAALEVDCAMIGGVAELPVRKAMLPYLRRQLGLPEVRSDALPVISGQLEVIE